MAKDRVSTDTVDQDHQDLMEAGYQPPKPGPASGDKLSRQLDEFADESRTGRGTARE